MEKNVNKLNVTILLISRSILFLLTQIAFFIVLYLINNKSTWNETIKYWPVYGLIGGLISYLIMYYFMKKEKESVGIFYKIQKQHIVIDVITIIIITIILVPLTFFSNIVSMKLLFNDPIIVQNIMFDKLPVWALILTFIFPIMTGISEVPLYYGYVLPKLAKYINYYIAIIFVIFFHLLQHCFLPLVFDVRFIVLRFVMFIPLAILLAIVITWRRRLIPYIVVIHTLLDYSAVLMFLK